MKGKKIAALCLSGIMTASMLMGCGGVNKEAVVATFDEKEVKLGVANFAARLQQANYDDFYVAYFGKEVWSSDMYGTGTTMESEVKTSALQGMFDMYTLQAHMSEYGVELTADEQAAITQTAADFIAANDEKALEALGADTAIVEEYLTLMTIQNKMQNAIMADVDTNVSDEEANTGVYSYVQVSKASYQDEEGNYVAYTEEELAELSGTVEAFAKDAAKKSLEEAAETYAYTVSKGTFTAADENLDAGVLTALKSLNEGDISEVVETDEDYYVLRLDAKVDAEETETTRQNIISEREETLYKEVLSGWQEGHTWTVDEKVWETVTFDNLFTSVIESTETEEVTATEE